MFGQNRITHQKGDFIAIFILLISISVSLLISYNALLESENKEPLFSKDQAYNIILINRFVLLFVFLYFLYIGYINYEKLKQKKDGLIPSNLKLFSDIINVVAALVAVYITVRYPNFTEYDFDEPVF